MKNKKKILAITYSRSEYDLLSYLFKLLTNDHKIDFKILVAGAHLSQSYGYTVDHIKEDGHSILGEIECLVDGNKNKSRLTSASIFLNNSIPLIDKFKPDIIIYAGDREEVLMGSILGGFLEIPTVHFFAGDHDLDGTIDNPIRHATSKMSSYLVTTLKEHNDRLISIGVKPSRIFNIGSPALDKFKLEKNRKVSTLLKLPLGFDIDNYALVIFHPLFSKEEDSIRDFKILMDALYENKISAIINSPNIDAGSRILINNFKKFENVNFFKFVNNLKRNEFVNIYRQAKFQIGNSSSGILEAASIPIPVINVGERMIGRKSQKNVVFCDVNKVKIKKSIMKVLSEEFRSNNLEGIKNIYGEGDASKKAYKLLKELNTKNYKDFRRDDPLKL